METDRMENQKEKKWEMKWKLGLNSLPEKHRQENEKFYVNGNYVGTTIRIHSYLPREPEVRNT